METGRWGVLEEVARTVRSDLEDDRLLRYLLALALFAFGFWFWWRSPNFATADEYGRLLRPMKAGGQFVADPGVASFVDGATDGVPQGASFYLYAVTLVPAAIAVLVTGRLGEFGSFAEITSRWELWQAVPEWYWHATILSARLANVVLGLACVYVLYRLGTAAWNRRAGRYAGLLLVLTLGFVGSVHEADEDTAMVLALLATTYLALRFVQTGRSRDAYWGAFAGGVAISFKLTAGTTVVILLAALFVRGRVETDGRLRSSVQWVTRRPRFVGLMAAIGAATIYVGRPHVLLRGPGELLYRFTWASEKTGPEQAEAVVWGVPSAEAVLWAAGLPLTIGVAVAVGWHLVRTGTGSTESHLPWLVLPALAVYALVFGGWVSIKAHHVLPAVVLGVLLLAGSLDRLHGVDSSRAAPGLIAVLLLSTAAFAGVGTLSIASDPRDGAAAWLDDHAEGDERVLVYDNSVADVGVPHGQPLVHYDFYEAEVVSNAVLNESEFTEWIVSSPDLEPDYVVVTASQVPPPDAQPSADDQYPERTRFFDRLVRGDHFGYEVAAEFGDRPHAETRIERPLRLGVVPDVEKREQYVLLLCHPSTCD